ncbi:MAG: hypothetical protein RLP44_05070 [Aggregatilineales bacterium]
MSLKRVTLLAILVLTFGILQLSVVNAGSRADVRWTAGCEGFTSNGGGIILDRDNTGNGQERFVITVVDGEGNVIFGPVDDSIAVGSRLSFTRGVFFPYSAEPASNPILLTVTSPAGNGLSDQLIYGTLGICGGIPFNNETLLGAGALFNIIDGRTSPTVPLNVDPPRPTNPENIGIFTDGYLIVNTASLNIRSGDGPQYTLVGRVAGGTELVVLGRNPSRSWWFVQVGEVTGWVNNIHVALRGDLTTVPIVPVTGELFPARFVVYADTDIRIAPSENAAALCTVEGNLEYFVVGQNSNGTWLEIMASCDVLDVTGWLPLEAGAIRNSGDLPIPVTWR